MKRICKISLLLFLCFLTAIGIRTEMRNRKLRKLTEEAPSYTQLRKMTFTEDGLKSLLLLEKKCVASIGTLVKLQYLQGDGIVREASMPELEHIAAVMQRNGIDKSLEFTRLFQEVWNDLSCFPVACDTSYEESWMLPRTYGGSRGHEGCDLFPPQNINGFYQIYAVTDGRIEQKGWLPMGGYRLGIRAPGGGYFYYAHLSEYAEGLEVGDMIEAGQVIGLMGSSGYSVTEGTSGRFPVHLHFGIYVKTEQYPELGVNPYWILRYLDAKR